MEQADWHREIFEVFRDEKISLVAHVPDAGHAYNEPGIAQALVNATDRFAG